MGTTVIGGMLAASAIGIFFIPAIFYVVETLSGAKRKDIGPCSGRRIQRRPPEMRCFALLTFGLLLAGCMVGPNYQRPAIDAPGAYRGDSQSSIALSESLGDEKWWEVFQDPVLQQLIRTAIRAELRRHE